MPSNVATNTNHTTLLKNQSAKIISLKCVSSQISGVKYILCALSIFGISKIPTYCLKEHWSRDVLVQLAYCLE